MKRKLLKSTQSKSVAELKKLMAKAQEDLVRLRTDLGSGKLKDVHQVKKKKRDLARYKTILREKELKSDKKRSH
jgi:large subunit ribosomal protein L29